MRLDALRQPQHDYFQSCGETADKLSDAGEDGSPVARENPVIDAVEFDVSRLCDVAGKMPASANSNGVVVPTELRKTRRPHAE